MEPDITWYDVLGVLPGAEARRIMREYDAKAALLRPEMISGAPPNVLKTVTRAHQILDAAWQVLGDPESRKRYDEAVGLRRSGGGLGQPGTGLESSAMAPPDPGIIGDIVGGLPGVDMVAALLGLTDWPRPRRRRSRPAAVPDLRGLFYPVSLEVAGRFGLHVTTIRLTECPMAVDGLVVDQNPRPPTTVHQGDKLTMQVWHPPAR